VAEAAFWGLVTGGSLLLGAALVFAVRPRARWIGLAMAFGGGALIASVAYELVEDAYAANVRQASVGFALGALTFYVGDWAIDRRGGAGRKSMHGEQQLAGSANAIVLGTVLDGIPESFVLGASIVDEGVVPTAVVVGVFVSNVPEALSGTTGLLEAGWSRLRILAMWTSVVLVSVAAAVAGWLVLDSIPTTTDAFALAFAGGAVLVMLADTLVPEALKLAGREAGLLTALGFAVGFALS
jgi:ZIP family zinc transporter